MSGIAPSEFILIIIIGLIILGPKRLPQVANQLGSWLGQARRMTRMMKRQLEEEVNLDLNSINKPFDIEKGLGLKDEPEPAKAPRKDADVSRPEYVHERKFDDQPADDETIEALPDDYSPAHATDEVGTGVGDDHLYDETPVDAPETVVASDEAADDDSKLDDGDDIAEPPQKETA